jgi:hypothetical protein
VANLPATVPAGSPPQRTLNPVQEQIARAIFDGMKPGDIARKLAPDDRRERTKIRAQVRRLAASDPVFQARIGEMAQGHLIMSLGTAVRGLERAAGRGRSDAIKLLFEATGFHQSKQQHEHSGEIKVKLDIPRPPVLDDEGRPEKVVDADVVEDE